MPGAQSDNLMSLHDIFMLCPTTRLCVQAHNIYTLCRTTAMTTGPRAQVHDIYTSCPTMATTTRPRAQVHAIFNLKSHDSNDDKALCMSARHFQCHVAQRQQWHQENGCNNNIWQLQAPGAIAHKLFHSVCRAMVRTTTRTAPMQLFSTLCCTMATMTTTTATPALRCAMAAMITTSYSIKHRCNNQPGNAKHRCAWAPGSKQQLTGKVIHRCF